MLSMQLAAVVMAVSGVGETVLLDFNASWCGPCRAMDPVVSQLASAGYAVRKVDIDREPELASRYGVRQIPCFVMLVNGQEADRVVGQTDISRLQAMYSRGSAGSAIARGQSPPGPVRRFLGGLLPGRSAPASGDAASLPPGPQSSRDPFIAAAGASQASANAGLLPTALLNASVRLVIEDKNGFSYGSGTLIDARAGEALVLTCGHVFRDSQGQGRISVDLFGPGAPKKVPGQLVGYDLKRDVGLVSIRPRVPVTVARVAPKNHRLQPGDKVINIGCNNGADPTLRESQVTAVNKYLGPSNVQVAGQPVQGRSGGGLFTPDGLVVGVCNAADPADNEGLYASAATIQAQLDSSRLTALYDAAPTASSAVADNSRSLPEQMPLADLGESRLPLVAVPTDMRVEPAAARAGLSPAEQATLAAISKSSGSAEVICIVRSLTEPQSKSEIVVIDRASNDFLRQLSSERRAQDARHLTSLDVPRPRAASAANRRTAAQFAPNWRSPR